MTIDLNCDMGESWNDQKVGQDAAIMPLISSCNLACGLHGGDPDTMHATITLALQHGVSIGAHPSLPGRENFGREPIDLPADELFSLVLTQVQSLIAAAMPLGGSVQHLKPHGALYNLATTKAKEANVVCEVCKAVGIQKLYGPPGSQLEKYATSAALTFIPEGFIDRVYANGLQLRSRKQPDAIIHDSDRAAAQALRFVSDEQVLDYAGNIHPHRVKTLCIHGDHSEAVMHLKAVHRVFTAKGIQVTAAARERD